MFPQHFHRHDGGTDAAESDSGAGGIDKTHLRNCSASAFFGCNGFHWMWRMDINDLARAHVAAVDRMTDGRMQTRYEIFNVGTGRPVSVNVHVAYQIVLVVLQRFVHGFTHGLVGSEMNHGHQRWRT